MWLTSHLLLLPPCELPAMVHCTHTLWAEMHPSFLVTETGKVINTDASYVIRNHDVSWKNLEETGCYSTSISSNSSNFCSSGLCSPQIFRNVRDWYDHSFHMCQRRPLSVQCLRLTFLHCPCLGASPLVGATDPLCAMSLPFWFHKQLAIFILSLASFT